jgi:hypothetical protein
MPYMCSFRGCARMTGKPEVEIGQVDEKRAYPPMRAGGRHTLVDSGSVWKRLSTKPLEQESPFRAH